MEHEIPDNATAKPEPANEPDCRATPGSAQSKGEQALRLRITALYHTCLSSAAFKREDALKSEDEEEEKTLRREATAFEQCAGWLYHATK